MAGHTNGALGVKAAQPERTVVVGCGDGAYLMSGFELMTAVEYNLPVIWIIFNDGEFKLIKIYQAGTYLDHALTDFRNPDYVAYAKACGADGYRVETLAEFERALKAALAGGRPALIDASITRLALPPYTPSPHGFLAGAIEIARQRLGSSPQPGILRRLWQRAGRIFGRD
jgi:acetolactate synthase-1/2/3 large subunit